MGYQEGMDDLEEYPVGVRVRILAAQVKASANLATWLFLGQGEMFFSTCVHEKEFFIVFETGKMSGFFI